MEYHPRLDINKLFLPFSKIILGSFPIWTEATLNCKTTTKPSSNFEFPFFFGSSTNQFWHWYKLYLDPDILLLNRMSIENSLDKNQIGITDIILSCERKGKSSLDKHLSKRTYNYSFLKSPANDEVLKIMCTSKGVLNEMLLSKTFFEKYKDFKVNKRKSDSFQTNFLKKIKGNNNQVKNPLFIELKIKNTTGIIQCLALPSPGSPYRKLEYFGIGQNDKKDFLQNYLIQAFDWFNK